MNNHMLLMVIIYHSATYDYSIIDNPNSTIVHVRYFLQMILATSVPLFFFANGYLMLNRAFDLKKHIIKSIKIVILTFVWGLIGVVCIAQIEGIRLSSFELLKDVWSWRPIGWINHLWYMGTLICIYVFFPLLKSVFDHHRKLFIYFTVIVTIFTFGNTLINHTVTLLLNAFGKANMVYSLNWFNIFNPFRGIYGYAFTYFCLGGLAHQYKDKILSIGKRKRNLIAIISIIVSCLILFVFSSTVSNSFSIMWDVVWDGDDTIPTAVNVLAIFVLLLNYNKHFKIFKVISLNTLGIYFMHNIFINLFKPMALNTPFFCTFTGCIVFSILILLLCLFVTLLLKNIPLLKNLVNKV